MTRPTEPCLCGDPYCRRCFPYNWDRDDAVEDREGEKERQKDTDSESQDFNRRTS